MASRTRHDVRHMPPPWKRSLTESGMSRRVTHVDRIAVAAFVLLLIALAAWIAAGGAL
jgi:hypothetical protein